MIPKLDLEVVSRPSKDVRAWQLPTERLCVDWKYHAVKEFTHGRFVSYQELVDSPGIDVSTPNYRFRYETDESHNQLVVSRLNKSTQGVPYGWKFHISLADETPEGLARAWRCVIPIIKQYRVNVFKMIIPREGCELEIDPKIQGRTMTLYACKEILTLSQWRQLLIEITQQLQKQGLRPGARSTICSSIGDNSYLSYRNETRNGRYLAAHSANNYNPDNLPDPFHNMMAQEVGSSYCPCPFVR